MTTRVRADCYFNPAAPNPNLYNEIFASCVGFLSSTIGQSLGIQLVESNFGRNGLGLGFWDTAQRAGPGAFAVFRFLSASYGMFDMMITVGSGTNTDANGVKPMNIDGAGNPNQVFNSNGYVGVSFAIHPSGSLTFPWNGTTGSFTSGTIGSPVWKPDTSNKGGVFPRNNTLFGGTGVASAQRNFMNHICNSNGNTVPSRHHFILTEDSFTTAWDNGNTGAYQLLHFGSFTVRSGSSYDSPYALIRGANNAAPAGYTTVYGSVVAAPGALTADGAIAHPVLSLSGTRIMTYVVPGGSQVDTNIGGFNMFVNSGSFDILPMYVAIRESPDNGIVGVFNNLAIGFNMATDTVNPASSSAAFGSSVTSTFKFITQWAGPGPRAESISRTGRDV